MQKAAIQKVPDFFRTYISKCPDDESLLDLLERTQDLTQLISLDRLISHKDFAYQPGKWTVAQVIQHLIDTERIFAYRILRFARNDQTVLPGFDEQLFSEYALVTHRSMNDLVDEFALVRQATIALIKSLPAEAFHRIGNANGYEMDVVALGFTAAGHVLHHIGVLQERYFN